MVHLCVMLCLVQTGPASALALHVLYVPHLPFSAPFRHMTCVLQAEVTRQMESDPATLSHLGAVAAAEGVMHFAPSST